MFVDRVGTLVEWPRRNIFNDSDMLTGGCLCTANKYVITDEDAAVARKVKNSYIRGGAKFLSSAYSNCTR